MAEPSGRGRLELTHVDGAGRASMVDVGGKAETRRAARATGRILIARETVRAIRDNALEKGDVLGVARVAGIQAAKETSRLIPLCHPLPLEHVALDLVLSDEPSAVFVSATVRTSGRTGVEMEALTAVSVALLTLYDMVKAVDRGAVIGEIALEEKSGGKSGAWRRAPAPASSPG